MGTPAALTPLLHLVAGWVVGLFCFVSPGPVISLQYLFAPLSWGLVKGSKYRIGDQMRAEA